jgi:Tfp pilus assembly protein PilO
MAKQQSAKHTQIDKTNTRVVVITALAAVIVVFSLVASYALFKQMMYQNKVLGKKKEAVSTLKQDLEAVTTLKQSYTAFVASSVNILGGNAEGTGERDGDNAKVVLDALPSNYDYPALITSIEKLVTDQGAKITSISGTDDQIAQSAPGSSTPQPIDMPFDVVLTGNYEQVQNVLKSMDKSIRPIQMLSVQLAAGQEAGEITASIRAKTYYQPAKLLQIRKEVVR